MFHVITKFGENIKLTELIDNMEGGWYVGVKEINLMGVMLLYLPTREYIVLRSLINGIPLQTELKRFTFEPGYYSKKDILRQFRGLVNIRAEFSNGILTLYPDGDAWFELSTGLAHFLGYEIDPRGKNLAITSRASAATPIEDIYYPLVNFHLRGVEGMSFNGQSTTILKSIVYSNRLYGARYDNPDFMKLKKELFTEILLELRNEDGAIIKNYEGSIHIILEFKKITF